MMLKRLAQAIIPNLPHKRQRALAEFKRFKSEVPHLGLPVAVQLAFQRCLALSQRGRIRSIRLPGFRFPLFYRVGTSDPDSIHPIFVRQKYDCVARLPGIEYIVDCGANIGASAFYLLNRYPRAQVAVVEPDPENMAICRKNLAPFGKQVTFLQAGVWSTTGPLVIERERFRDRIEWSYQVRPARENEPGDVPALTITDVMTAAGFPRIDLLKVDIEKAENEVFRSGAQPGLRLTRNLVIEPHGLQSERVIQATLAAFDCQVIQAGDLTLYRNMTPRECPSCS